MRHILLLFALLTPLAGLYAQAPVNDDFVDAEELVDEFGATFGSNVDATQQAGEPVHATVGTKSVWYTWTAPATAGSVSFDTAGSFLDTVLVAYTGNSVGGLTVVASNDDIPGDPSSRITFATMPNAVYRIAVSGKAGAEDDFSLEWYWNEGDTIEFSPAAFTVTEGVAPAVITIKRIGPATGTVVVHFTTSADTASEGDDYTDVDTFVTFTGGQHTKTVNVPILNDTDTEPDPETVSLTLDIDSTSGGAIATLGISSATLTIEDDDDPANDDFANAQLLPGSSGAVDGSNDGADAEIGEPDHGAASIWYRWVAPGNGVAVFDTDGSFASPAAVYVYTGTSVSALTEVTHDDDGRVVFAVASGTTYRIAVTDTTAGGFTSDVHLAYSFTGGGAVLQLVPGPYFIMEKGATSATITVQRSGNLSGTSTVQYTATSGSALSGSDFVPASGTLTFGPTVATQTFTVTAVNDPDNEGEHSFTVDLSNAGGTGVLGSTIQADVVIYDDEDDSANNDFANAATISGASDTATGTTVGADPEAGETIQLGGSGHSVWYKWTAPSSGVVTFSVDSASHNHVISAYTGISVGTLLDAGTFSGTNTSFAVLAGAIYYIAADADGSPEPFTLSWQYSTGGLFEFKLPVYTIKENGAGQILVTITRTGATTASSVDVFTQSSSATSGSDFTGVSQTVNFAAADTVKTVSITIANDAAVEGDESFLLQLSSPTGGGALGAFFFVSANILDDDDDPANNAFASATVLSGFSGNSNGSTAGADREAGEPVHIVGGARTVWHKWTATSNGSVDFSVAGTGFSAVCAAYTGAAVGSLTPSAAGAASINFAVTNGTTYYIAVDGSTAGSGAFTLTWNFTPAPAGALQFTAVPATVGENAGTFAVQVERVSGTNGAITVQYNAASGTATVGSDFVAASGTLSFADGETMKTFNLTISEDTIDEADETFVLQLSNPTGNATLGATSQVTLAIVDNDSPAPIAPIKATYRGLINTGGLAAQTGTLTVTTTNKGAITAKVSFGGTLVSFTGKLDAMGAFTKTLTIKKLGTVTVTVQLADGGDGVTGTLNVAGTDYALDGGRAFFDGKAKVAPYTGKFTAVLPATSGVDGVSWMTLTIAKTGVVKIAGALADNNAFTFSGALTKAGTFPIFLSLYKKAGYVAGDVSFDLGSINHASATLDWFKPVNAGKYHPTGIDTTLSMDMQRYTERKKQRVIAELDASAGVAHIDFTDGQLAADFSAALDVSTKNVVKVTGGANPDKVSVKIAPATGVVSGGFTRAFTGAAKPLTAKFKGVFHQDNANAQGFFLGVTESGKFEFAPGP